MPTPTFNNYKMTSSSDIDIFGPTTEPSHYDKRIEPSHENPNLIEILPQTDRRNRSRSTEPPQPNDRLTRAFGSVITKEATTILDVIVIVGPDLEEFRANARNLKQKSGYFNRALSGTWTESTNQQVELLDVNPHVYAVMNHWFVSGNLAITKEMREEASLLAVECWILGDRLLSNGFQNAIADFLCTSIRLGGGFDSEACQVVFRHTTEDAKLRQLVADSCVWRDDNTFKNIWRLYWPGGDDEEIPVGFVRRVLYSAFDNRKEPWRDREKMCKFYHVHEKENTLDPWQTGPGCGIDWSDYSDYEYGPYFGP